MEYKVGYQVENIIRTPLWENVELDGEIGIRFERFVHERVNGKFAIDEILREAEDFIRDKYDDEYCCAMWRCEFWGKLILSAVRVCKMKSDAKLKEDIRNSVYKILQYQDANGYVGSYQDRTNIFQTDREKSLRETGTPYGYNWNIWGQKYTLWALLESAQLLDDAHILACCVRLADQLIALLEQLHVRVKDAGVIHGLPTGSILKPMLVLYRLTGDPKYDTFCQGILKEWEREDNECPNLIKNALSKISPANWYPEFLPNGEKYYAKAYEMMSCFDGIIEYYRISADEKYLEAAKCFWDSVWKDEENILGSVGYCERFANAAAYPDSATEICDVIHWMRLCHELFSLTGEVKYMEAFEKAFMNAFLAGLYEDGRSCAFFIRSAGRHLVADWQVESKYQHCCLNNVGRGYVNAAESVMMASEEGYYLNMYTAARVRFGKTSFRIGAGYADNGAVAITVRGAEAGQKLYLRIPAWSKKTTITIIGGETFEISQCGIYYGLPLSGADQVIRLAFDMTPEIIDFAGVFQNLPAEDYHIYRWIDGSHGLCDREQMLKHPMSVIRRGPVMLARSKRMGCSEAEMFSGETVFGKERTITAQTIRHDHLQTMCRVTITCEGKEHRYIMCDVASAANKDLEEIRYFSMFV